MFLNLDIKFIFEDNVLDVPTDYEYCFLKEVNKKFSLRSYRFIRQITLDLSCLSGKVMKLYAEDIGLVNYSVSKNKLVLYITEPITPEIEFEDFEYEGNEVLLSVVDFYYGSRISTLVQKIFDCSMFVLSLLVFQRERSLFVLIIYFERLLFKLLSCFKLAIDVLFGIFKMIELFRLYNLNALSSLKHW